MEQKDHDMLIKLNTKVGIMCTSLNTLITNNDIAHSGITKLLEKKVEDINDKYSKIT